jgi:hypothetical protein
MRAIPEDNLAYPILVTNESGQTGSGFYLNTDTSQFFVTARHVLFKENSDELLSRKVTLLSYPKDPSSDAKNIFVLDTYVLNKDGQIAPHASKDVVVVHVGGSEPGQPTVVQTVAGVTIQATSNSAVIGVGVPETVKRFEEVLVANEVFVFGYPTSLGLQNIPQIDYQRPLLRKGIVAGTNRKTKTIILDCPVYPGNSGGPVMEVEKTDSGLMFRAIGVVSQFVPAAEMWLNTTYGYTNLSMGNSGYSVAVAMDFVLELMENFSGK